MLLKKRKRKMGLVRKERELGKVSKEASFLDLWEEGTVLAKEFDA